MEIKRNKSTKVIVIAIAILLCLALAVGITGAFYQAQRRAIGTVKMDKGIVIDYTGFGKTPNEGTWLRETTISFKLFEDADVQPGEKISLNDAGIKANTTSVDFYARVKLDYEFYNGETKLETLPASFKASDLITTSSTFFGADWVKSSDGYHYYATGTTLNKFTSSTPATFVDLFDTNAQFIIEGAGFTGAENKGEGGGFVVDETTSINKIVVYLTLETLQGDADATAEGWEISAAADVVFAEATPKLETSVGKVETTENLNVSVGGAAEVPLSEVVFPYDTTTTLKFDSNNVEYVTLTYSNGDSETFDAETYEVAENTFQVYADSTKGTVKGYTVGLFSDSEYTGLIYRLSSGSEKYLIINGYLGESTEYTISTSEKVKERTGKMVFEYESQEQFFELIDSKIELLENYFPFTVSNYSETIDTREKYEDFLNYIGGLSEEQFLANHGNKLTISFTAYFKASGWVSSYTIKEIGDNAFSGNENLTNITLTENITKIGEYAFGNCTNLEAFVIPNSVTEMGVAAFSGCNNLTSITIGTGLSYIAESALSGKFTSITIPSNINEIRKDALGGCANLTQIVCESAIPPTLGNSAIPSNLTAIYVPAESVETYKAANGWSVYADKIQAIA
ncbi:MAG: leucine-rich repeat domain-containing protein [Firmicutes bacterium]|nr:leucine-rich repeat domain-containing protein [Bacillota bacterium]